MDPDIRMRPQKHGNEKRPPLRWGAHEHRHFERGRDWYIALGVIAVATSLTAILFGDILFALLIIVAAITMGIAANTPPRHINFEITEKGLRTGDEFHSYKEILAFWVSHDEATPLLLVDTTKFMSPNLIIPIEEIHPEAVRSYLLPHAKEVEMHEPLPHKIMEFFGF